jgi:hypothetical protein
MNRREKILAAAVVLLLAALGGSNLFGRYREALDARVTAAQDARQRLAAVNMKLAKGRSAVRQMEEWQARSLPNDREKALSLYKAWLLDKAKTAGLEVTDINPTLPTASTAYSALGYQIKASGSLSAVAAMLYEFYRNPLLHQITRLDLSRPQGSKIDVQLDVEAISLPGATVTESLPEGESKRLKLASLDEYQKSLSDRDLVSVYTPPRPPGEPRAARPTPPKFDDAEQAHFSGAVGSGAALQAWINVRTTGETLHLSAGDPIKVGTLEGQVVSVEPRSLVFEADGKKFRVALGQSLRSGKEIESDEAPSSKTPAATPET